MIMDGHKIECRMAELGYTNYKLCKLSGLSSETLWKALDGHSVRPTVVHKFAKALGVSPKQLCREYSDTVVKVVLDDGGRMPTRAHETDAGYDIYSPIETIIYPGESVVVDTKVRMAIPAGYVGFLKSKSGLNVKDGIQNEGVIDSGYTGTIAVKLYNHGSYIVRIGAGQKISQLVLLPILTPDLIQVDSLEETERGNGGFGSTGKF